MENYYSCRTLPEPDRAPVAIRVLWNHFNRTRLFVCRAFYGTESRLDPWEETGCLVVRLDPNATLMEHFTLCILISLNRKSVIHAKKCVNSLDPFLRAAARHYS